MTIKEKENKLKELLDELLEYGNQNGSIISLKINKNNDGQTCTVIMSVVEIKEDNYIGFAGY